VQLPVESDLYGWQSRAMRELTSRLGAKSLAAGIFKRRLEAMAWGEFEPKASNLNRDYEVPRRRAGLVVLVGRRRAVRRPQGAPRS
jgi:hypothetical protein